MFHQWTPVAALLVLIWSVSVLAPWIGHRPTGDRLDALFLAWLVWLALTPVWSQAPEFSERVVYAMVLLPLAFLSWRRWPQGEAAWPWLLRFLWLFAAGLALWGILEPPSETYTGKPDGPYVDPNVYAASLNLLGLPLAAVYLRGDGQRPRWVDGSMLLALGLTVLAFFMAASRGASLAALVLFPLILWKMRGQRGYAERLVKLGIAGAVAYFAAKWVMAADVATRLAGTISTGDNARWVLWKSTWKLIEQDPWLGTGLGTFPFNYPLVRDAADQITAGAWVHNDYLQLWQEGGLPTLLLLVAMLAMVLWQSWLAYQASDGQAGVRLGLLAGCLAIFMQAGVNFLLYLPFPSLLMGLFLAQATRRAEASDISLALTLAIRPSIRKVGLLMSAIAAGYLMLTQAAIQYVLSCSRPGLYLIENLSIGVKPYKIAEWLAVLRPDAGKPQITMAQIIDERLARGGTGHQALDMKLFAVGAEHYQQAHRGNPCYLPVGIYQADFLLRNAHFADKPDHAAKAAADAARQNLVCNPRHGLSHVYLAMALLADNDKAGAEKTLKSGYPKALFSAEQLLLLSAWLDLRENKLKPESEGLTRKIASTLQLYDLNPTTHVEPEYWLDAEDKINRRVHRLSSNTASVPVPSQ